MLLINADREAAASTKQFLVAAGHAVTTAGTGSMGVERALSHPWWAIILDARLPDMDGLEVLRRIRRKCGAPLLLHLAQADE